MSNLEPNNVALQVTIFDPHTLRLLMLILLCLFNLYLNREGTQKRMSQIECAKARMDRHRYVFAKVRFPLTGWPFIYTCTALDKYVCMHAFVFPWSMRTKLLHSKIKRTPAKALFGSADQLGSVGIHYTAATRSSLEAQSVLVPAYTCEIPMKSTCALTNKCKRAICRSMSLGAWRHH